MITREFPPMSGGIGYYVYNLSKKLLESGHEVTVITRGSMGKSVIEFVEGIRVFKVSFFPLYPFHTVLHGMFVGKLLQSLEPELTLVHLHSPIVPPINTSLPILTTVHTLMKIDSRYHEVYDPYSLAEKIQSMFVSPSVESKLLEISDRVTTVSPTVANELREYGINPNTVKTVWNGVDEKIFSLAPRTVGSERNVLYTGVLRARKGLFDLMKCAKLVNAIFPDVKFKICGTGPLLSKLKEQARSDGLQDQIIFLGRVNKQKLIQTYQNATIQVIPSIYEGLPTVLLEAMSCGLPVVATNIGGIREVISSGENGILFSPGSPKEMADAIIKLLNDESLRIKLGSNARETILEKYTWDRISDNFIDIYKSILKK